MTPPVALITGAGRGIGKATAMELARRGYQLALAARSTEQLKETAESVSAGFVLPTDVSDPKQVDSLIAKTVEKYGRIDAVVHCAGVAPTVTVEQMTDAQWHEVLDVNLSSAFYLSRAVWPIFRRQQSGVIVNISSLSSRDPFPGFAAYGAAKAALNVFSLVLAREGKEIGVRVHTIAPGPSRRKCFANWSPSSSGRERKRSILPTSHVLSPSASVAICGTPAAKLSSSPSSRPRSTITGTGTISRYRAARDRPRADGRLSKPGTLSRRLMGDVATRANATEEPPCTEASTSFSSSRSCSSS
jgi:3-oxoacyl-[acyl-carrier protein] reductase